jgi:quercetin dioxygenase-like cupin family protein
MQKKSLDAVAREQLHAAHAATSKRAAVTVFGGHEHVMRQTVIALLSGSELAEHENPGEATILVLLGRVELVVGTDCWQGRAGDLLIVPPARHSLRAAEDCAVLLTAVPRSRPASL